MPIYEYECEKCTYRFELKSRFDEHVENPCCPICQGKVRQLYSPRLDYFSRVLVSILPKAGAAFPQRKVKLTRMMMVRKKQTKLTRLRTAEKRKAKLKRLTVLRKRGAK